MELKAYTNFPVEWGHLLILQSYVECWWLTRNNSEKIWDCVGKIQSYQRSWLSPDGDSRYMHKIAYRLEELQGV